MAGWSSNNKFSVIGAFRQVAVMVSFEIPMLAVLLIPTIFSGSMGMNTIIQSQNIWYVFLSPLAALIFLIAAIAELGIAHYCTQRNTSRRRAAVAGRHIFCCPTGHGRASQGLDPPSAQEGRWPRPMLAPTRRKDGTHV